MAVLVKFVGSLCHISGAREIALAYSEGFLLKDLILKVVTEKPGLESSLIDRHLEDPKPNALVLVNGREISVLKGLETALKDGDEVVFVPVVHGG